MKDPYIQENGVLKNKLGITEYQKLKTAEIDIGYVKLINGIDNIKTNGKYDINLIRDVHRYIFEDIFDWAGEFRKIDILKWEDVLSGMSLEYENPKKIKSQLNRTLREMNQYKWKKEDIDDTTTQMTRYLSKIWRIHPFRDGNTRATLMFGTIFAKEHGFEIDIDTLIDSLNRKINSETNKIKQYSVRDKFVLASVDELPEPEHLESIMRKALEKDKKPNKSKYEHLER